MILNLPLNFFKNLTNFKISFFFLKFSHSTKLYKMTISNLRMATKYSFHVRPQLHGESEKIARSQKFSKDDKSGQTIVIPTKGFSAVATKCLPNESEILVETGPNFGGRISSENGECSIQGNAKDGRDAYTMRIDHERCGSQVSHEDLTVETYITVQENSGILTHSTRRFLVVCTFQPDTLTVRARLALPGKGDVIVDEEWNDRERTSRNRQFKMVDKSALILKESNEHSMENAIGDVENLTEKILAKDDFKPQKVEIFNNARFSRYSSDSRQKSYFQFFDAFTGITIGIALIVLVVFLAFYTFRRDRNVQHMEKLTETTAVFN